MSSRERRSYERIDIRTPIGIEAVRGERAGVTRNLSAKGVLFHSPSQFSIGEELEVFFRVTNQECRCSGRVVRIELDPNIYTSFPHLTAVEFDQPVGRLHAA